MDAGFLTKRLKHIKRRLHKTMDGLPETVEISAKLDSIDELLDSALASVEARAREKLAKKRVGETSVAAKTKAEKAQEAEVAAKQAAAEASEATAEARQAAAAVKGTDDALRKRNVRKKGRPPLKKREDDGHDEGQESRQETHNEA